YAQTMVACGKRMQTNWHNGETLDIAEEMMRLTLNVVAKTLFNADVESEAREIGESLTATMKMFDRVTLPFAGLINKLPLPSNFPYRRAENRLEATVYAIFNEHRASGGGRGDLLSMLLMAKAEEEGSGSMTDRELRAEAMPIFLAGHETTANALTW